MFNLINKYVYIIFYVANCKLFKRKIHSQSSRVWGNKAARVGHSGVTKPGSDWTHGLANYGILSRGPELLQKWAWLAAQMAQSTHCRAWKEHSTNVSCLYSPVALQNKQGQPLWTMLGFNQTGILARKGQACGGTPCNQHVGSMIREKLDVGTA